MACERVALDVCQECLTGTCNGGLNYPDTFCRTEGCAMNGQPRTWDGLASKVKVMWPAELMAVVEAARLSVDNCGCGLPKPADVEALKFYIVEDEAGASEMCMSCLAILRALIAWDAVLDGSSGAPGNPASVSTLSSFSTTGAEEPSGTTPTWSERLQDAAFVAAQDIADYLRPDLDISQDDVTLFSERIDAVLQRELAVPANTVPPVADPGPAESQPARDPASDVHAGGGEPACSLCGLWLFLSEQARGVCEPCFCEPAQLDKLAAWVGVKK